MENVENELFEVPLYSSKRAVAKALWISYKNFSKLLKWNSVIVVSFRGIRRYIISGDVIKYFNSL